mgnify:CR=1 FL=1
MSRSSQFLERGRKVIPGGVNSPVRAFRAVGGEPPFIARGEGAEIIDEEGHRYIDCVNSWGALLLGHVPTHVLGAVTAAAARGSSFGAPTLAEVELAEAIVDRVPSVEMVRLVSSGTEATMHALRLARGATGRDLVVKMDGCYHGAHDSVLVGAGSGVATFAIPGSPGVPQAVAANTLVIPFNDLDAARKVFAEHGDAIAAVILEPIAGNMGCIPPLPGYLQGLRDLTAKAGSVLIFDEVMTGFRLGIDGAQGRFGITPDLSCFGKIIGGGLPVGAFGGRKEIMDMLAPDGPVYQAGTLSGNPLAMAAGITAIEMLREGNGYSRLEELGQRLEAGMKSAAESAGIPVRFQRIGSMFCGYFTKSEVHNLSDAMSSDRDRFAKYFHGMLENGVYLPPSAFESYFLNDALSYEDLDRTVEAVRAIF